MVVLSYEFNFGWSNVHELEKFKLCSVWHNYILQFYYFQLSVKSNSSMQKGNPLLKHIRNVRWEFADIVCDYLLGQSSCALYLRFELFHFGYTILYTCEPIVRMLCGKSVSTVIWNVKMEKWLTVRHARYVVALTFPAWSVYNLWSWWCLPHAHFYKMKFINLIRSMYN